MQNIQLEATVLSCMMQDYECAKEHGLLSEEDFVEEAHKQVLKAISELVEKKMQPDHITIYEHINQRIDLSYLMSISDTAPTTTGFKNYIKQLKDVTLKRKIIRLADDIKQKELTGKELSEYAEKEIFKLRQEVQTNDFAKAKDIVFDVIQNIEDVYKKDGITGTSTGYKAIDKMTDGFQKQDLIYLAARPSMGKTALALNIASNVSKKHNVSIFSLEMSKESLLKRMILSESSIPASRIKTKKMEDTDWQRLTNAGSKIYNSKIHIYDRNNLKVPDMLSMCRKLKKDEGLGLVIIDYLQLIPIKGDRYTGITNISISLKEMAKELDCPVLVLSQLSRAPELRNNKRPIMSDLRESGQIEQDADVIMFLYRDEYYNPDTEEKGVAEIIFAKQRNNSTGIVKLGWIGELTKFVDYDLIKGVENEK